MELFGCGTALVTPFGADGAVDEAALVRLVNWQIESGIHFLVPCGSTGEASTMTEAECLRVIELTAKTAAGRVPVVAGCTHNATGEACARAKRVAAIPGVNCILTASPFYNRPNQEGQYRHFRAIAESVDLPVLLYNIPSRTGANIEPATAFRLAELKNVIGIKESSGNVPQIVELIVRAPQGFKIFCGDDGLALPITAVGGAGLVSVASNVVPREMASLMRAALAGDWNTARSLYGKFHALIQALFLEPSPAPAKAAIKILGLFEDNLRLPMLPVADATRERLRTLLREAGVVKAS